MAAKRSYYWIKLNTAYLSDIKFLKLSDSAKYHYVALYLLSCECDSGGLLIQDGEILSISDLSVLLHADYKTLESSISELLTSGLLKFDDGFIITRYIDEQGPQSFGDAENKKRNGWVDRQAKSRANKRDKIIESDKIIEKDTDIEKDIDIESDIDIDKRVTCDKSVTFPVTNENGYFD